MTKKEHKKVGNLLKKIRKNLMTLDMNHPINKEISKVFRSIHMVDDARNTLDNIVCRDFPKDDDVTTLYFGELKKSL